MPWSTLRLLATIYLGVMSACVGHVNDETAGESTPDPVSGPGGTSGGGAPGQTPSGAPGVGGRTPSATVPSAACAAGPRFAGPAALRRLTRTEYGYTVADLLGAPLGMASRFPEEELVLGFDNNATSDVAIVSGDLVEGYESAAWELADRAAKDLPAFTGCRPPAALDDACVRRSLETFGRRAYRRPLDPAELDRYILFFNDQKAKAGGSLQAAFRAVIQAFLQSPYFLYRFEQPAPPAGAAARLSGYEVASRLSYLLWSSMPDEPLLQAAATGELGTADGILKQAGRLLDDPKAKRTIRNLFSQWLDLSHVESAEKDAKTFPAWNAKIAHLLRAETETFLDEVVLSPNGTLETLLQADFSYMNKDLAAFYGVAGPAGQTFERVSLDRTRRAGLLTQASFLASKGAPRQTSPVARGLFVRERFLCSPPPPPPADIETTVPEPDGRTTTRERFAAHRAQPACAGCHRLMDPLGLGFEHYDSVGLWRDTDGGRKVDATGEILATVDADGAFDGAIQLAGRLARSQQVTDCLVEHAFRFAYARAEQAGDRCALDQLSAAMKASGGTLRSLLLALTQTDPFLLRGASEGGQP